MFLGAIVLGAAADRYGRRRMLLVNLGWYSLFSALAAAAPNLTALVVARILGGLALGAELTLVGNYLGEFMPPAHRGRAMACSTAGGGCCCSGHSARRPLSPPGGGCRSRRAGG